MALLHDPTPAHALPQPGSKGDHIRAKIAANRQKRLAIAEAMKREAGVSRHDVNPEDFGGLAWIGTGRIWSPEGRKIIQLYTVAHECGHIFLHGAEPGYSLPSHIKEMEAESYAHQAFREHGMNLPKRLSNWGRTYVQSWIDKDRAAGIPIDPRVQAYANGTRSPYEPLRLVPTTWSLHAAEEITQPRSAMIWAPPRGHAFRTWHREAKEIAVLILRSILHGMLFGYFGLKLLHHYHPLPELFSGKEAFPTWACLPAVFTCGLVMANVRIMLRTLVR